MVLLKTIEIITVKYCIPNQELCFVIKNLEWLYTQVFLISAPQNIFAYKICCKTIVLLQ